MCAIKSKAFTMGIWSIYLACSHPDLVVDKRAIPEEMRDLLHQHGEDANTSEGSETLENIFRSFTECAKIWGSLFPSYLQKWAVTFKHLSSIAGEEEGGNRAFWATFLCREADVVFTLTWDRNADKCIPVHHQVAGEESEPLGPDLATVMRLMEAGDKRNRRFP